MAGDYRYGGMTNDQMANYLGISVPELQMIQEVIQGGDMSPGSMEQAIKFAGETGGGPMGGQNRLENIYRGIQNIQQHPLGSKVSRGGSLTDALLGALSVVGTAGMYDFQKGRFSVPFSSSHMRNLAGGIGDVYTAGQFHNDIERGLDTPEARLAGTISGIGAGALTGYALAGAGAGPEVAAEAGGAAGASQGGAAGASGGAFSSAPLTGAYAPAASTAPGAFYGGIDTGVSGISGGLSGAAPAGAGAGGAFGGSLAPSFAEAGSLGAGVAGGMSPWQGALLGAGAVNAMGMFAPGGGGEGEAATAPRPGMPMQTPQKPAGAPSGSELDTPGAGYIDPAYIKRQKGGKNSRGISDQGDLSQQQQDAKFAALYGFSGGMQ